MVDHPVFFGSDMNWNSIHTTTNGENTVIEEPMEQPIVEWWLYQYHTPQIWDLATQT